jgi:hexokinase
MINNAIKMKLPRCGNCVSAVLTKNFQCECKKDGKMVSTGTNPCYYYVHNSRNTVNTDLIPKPSISIVPEKPHTLNIQQSLAEILQYLKRISAKLGIQ